MLRFTQADWIVPAALITFSVVPVTAITVRMIGLASGAGITLENALI